MRLLGLDLGTNCGWCTMERDDDGVFHVHQTNTYKLRRVMELHGSVGRWIGFLHLLNEYGGDVDFIVYEHVSASVHTGSLAARCYGALHATLELWAKEHNKQIVPVTIQQVKKAMTGTGKADKKLMLSAAKKRFKGIPIVDHNQADAMGVCLAGFRALGPD